MVWDAKGQPAWAMPLLWEISMSAKYRCYWIAVHFASAEQATAFLNTHVFPDHKRLLRGGDALPLCYEAPARTIATCLSQGEATN